MAHPCQQLVWTVYLIVVILGDHEMVFDCGVGHLCIDIFLGEVSSQAFCPNVLVCCLLILGLQEGFLLFFSPWVEAFCQIHIL